MSGQDEQASIEGFVTLHVPCQNSYLRIVRQSISNLCVHAGLSEFKAAQLEMAVDEACASIIKRNAHAEAPADHDPERQGLRLNLIQKRDRIVVELYDYGPGVDFGQAGEVNPEDYADETQDGGLGLYVIKRFVDDIQYEPDTRKGNYLRLTKLL